jgi:hypothetical protein
LISAASSKRDYLIIGLTWEGHEFAANARDSGIWRKAQEKAKSISSSVSVSVLSDILKRIMMEAF